MSQSHSPEPTSPSPEVSGLDVASALAEMLFDASECASQRARDRRYPSGYRAASAEELGEAGGYDAVADSFSGLAYAIRQRFNLPG